MGTTSKRYVASGKPRGKARRRNRVMSALAGMIWPQRSLISHRELAGPGALEPELWSKLRFLSEPLCARCGMQFEFAVDPGHSSPIRRPMTVPGRP